jgi:hypothetical protein
VIQLINSKNPDGTIKPFTQKDMETMEILTIHASSAIVRGITAKIMILRMLALNTMRDPKETKGHFVVITGFDKRGDIVTLDPAAPSAKKARTVYGRKEFAAAWLKNKKGLFYFIWE